MPASCPGTSQGWQGRLQCLAQLRAQSSARWTQMQEHRSDSGAEGKSSSCNKTQGSLAKTMQIYSYQVSFTLFFPPAQSKGWACKKLWVSLRGKLCGLGASPHYVTLSCAVEYLPLKNNLRKCVAPSTEHEVKSESLLSVEITAL